ncbi:MAG: hypothetical protein F6J93_19695 [Oscillatoria sp. SIO1A7]|nr:hypothetical protein [Oscillatoria sp. SIO1A7]
MYLVRVRGQQTSPCPEGPPAPCSLLPAPCPLHPTPHTPHPTPHTPHPPHPTPCPMPVVLVIIPN